MCACVGHAVDRIVVGQEFMVRPTAKGKLQQFHAGQPVMVAQAGDIRRDYSQILSDEGQSADILLDGVKKIPARSQNPFAADSGFSVCRDAEICRKSPERDYRPTR